MSHRLFNSLVVSSTLLLEGGLTGCATSAPERASSEPSSPTPVAASSGAETASPETNDAETASATTNGEPETAAAAVTMASCEGGWHTTKAGPHCEVDTSGVTVCCPSYGLVTAENRASVCCVQADAAQ